MSEPHEGTGGVEPRSLDATAAPVDENSDALTYVAATGQPVSTYPLSVTGFGAGAVRCGNQVIAVQGPKGARGSPGDRGPKGAQGPSGGFQTEQRYWIPPDAAFDGTGW